MESEQLSALLERVNLDDCDPFKNLLQNELKGETVLHAAVSSASEEKARLVKALIEAGADCDLRNKRGFTPCEYALAVDDRELAIDMVTAELDHLPTDRAFYVLIRRGSIPEYELYLGLKEFEEQQVFQSVANALIELKAKRVPIDGKMDYFLQYSLAEYAFTNLRGFSGRAKNINEWRQHFQLIEENWIALRKSHMDRDFANIDNEFAHRIQTIHNQFYFIIDKRFLKYLPMTEIVYCLAMFSAIIDGQEQLVIFKWLINKVNMMQFLDVVCRQLRKVDQYLDGFKKQIIQMLEAFDKLKKQDKSTKTLLKSCWTNLNPPQDLSENILNKIVSCLNKRIESETIADDIIANENFKLVININYNDRSTLRKLRRSYFRAKQLYSIQKCLFHIQSLSGDFLKTRSDKSSDFAIRRIIQVVGEAIKSTKNSPNVPKKIEASVGKMLTVGFLEVSKSMREFFSHKISLSKQYLTDTSYFPLLLRWFQQVEVTFLIVFLCSTVEACRFLLGLLKRCQSLEQLKSLFQYIGDTAIMRDTQTKRFTRLEDIFRKFSETVLNLDISNVNYLDSLETVQNGLKVQNLVLFKLRRCLLTEWQKSFVDIKVACLGGASLATVRKMIDWSLTNCDHSEIYGEIQRNWNTNHVHIFDLMVFNIGLFDYNPSIMTGLMQKHESMLKSIKETEYLRKTKQILEDLNQTNPSDELMQTLHGKLSKYYEDIFALDITYQTIRTLFKQRKLPIDERSYQRMRKQDEEYLQQIFDNRIDAMRKLLQTFGLTSMISWAEICKRISNRVLLALEYYQLELSEIFISLGYFGDNFQLLKHGIPLIHGRNFRNYLAHDFLSYNILTQSNDSKVLANANVMVNNPISLFGKFPNHLDEDFEFKTSKQTLDWVMLQMDLAKSVQQMNCERIRHCLDRGAELSGILCGTFEQFDSLKCDVKCADLIDPNFSNAGEANQVREIFESKLPNSTAQLESFKYRSRLTFQRGRFEEAFEIMKNNRPVEYRHLPQYLFVWKQLVNHLPVELLSCNEIDQFGRTILHRLVEAGNAQGVSQLLERNPTVDTNKMDMYGNTAFDLAITHGFSDIVCQLLPKNPNISANSRQFAVINHLNDLLPQLFFKIDDELLDCETYIVMAVRANNCFALKFIIDHLYCIVPRSLRTDHLSSEMTLAAYFGHFEIVEFFLSLQNTDFFTDQSIAGGHPALQFAIRKHSFAVVERLLAQGASPNWVHPFETFTHRTAFQLAVNAGSCRVLRLMKNIDMKLYSWLKHPMSIAMENNSLKMIRYLQTMGFTFLDSNSILTTAASVNGKSYVEQVFQALDASIDSWKHREDQIGMIGQMIARWNALVYLEEPEGSSITPLMKAIDINNWAFVSDLFVKCKDLRKVGDYFISQIEVNVDENLQEPNQNQNRSNCFRETLLQLLRNFVESNSENLKCIPMITRTAQDIRVNCNRITSDKESSILELDFTSISSNSKSKESSQYRKIVQMASQLVKHSKDTIFGTIQETKQFCYHFTVSTDGFCIFHLCQTEPPQILKSLVNTPSFYGETPLHMVCGGKSNLDQVRLLLDNGADPIAQNAFGLTPLHISLVDLDCSKSLLVLEHCIAHNLKNSDGTSALVIANGHGIQPIHHAAMFCKDQAIELLLENKINVRVQDALGFHPAMYALVNLNAKGLKLLLDYDPELMNLANAEGETLLHISAKFESEACILLLLEYDVDITRTDRKGRMAPEIAVGLANATWIKIVLYYARISGIRGVFKGLGDAEFPLLHFVVVSNNAEIVQAVVEYEIDQDLSSELTEVSAKKLHTLLTSTMEAVLMNTFHLAVRYCFKDSLDVLLLCQRRYNEYGAEYICLAQDSVDVNGTSPLDYALETQDDVLIGMLLEK